MSVICSPGIVSHLSYPIALPSLQPIPHLPMLLSLGELNRVTRAMPVSGSENYNVRQRVHPVGPDQWTVCHSLSLELVGIHVAVPAVKLLLASNVFEDSNQGISFSVPS